MNPVRLFPFLLTVVCVARAEDDPAKPLRDPAYKLVWSDEFNHDGPPDPANWHAETGFTRNRELQWYQAANARCEGGTLVIEAKREEVVNPNFREQSRDWRRNIPKANYTSASLITPPNREWQFGRIEVRARFNALPGLWPAIWTTGRGRWPHGGEIDIMEFYQQQILANFVWAGPGGRDHWDEAKHPFKDFEPAAWNAKFHIWVMEWTAETISIHLDGKLLNTLDVKTAVNRDGPPVNPFLAPHRLRLNLAIGANGGDPDKTEFPQRYEVDYVRIYQK